MEFGFLQKAVLVGSRWLAQGIREVSMEQPMKKMLARLTAYREPSREVSARA